MHGRPRGEGVAIDARRTPVSQNLTKAHDLRLPGGDCTSEIWG